MNDAQQKDLFQKVFGENIMHAKNALLTLEQTPSKKEVIKNLHRFFHSLKGEALSMGYTEQGMKAKEHEDFLYSVIYSERTIDTHAIDSMKNTLQAFEEFINTRV